MTKGKLSAQSKTTNLVAALLQNPQLPAYITQLNGPHLSHLVQHIGKEDAQELLAFATPEQITDLIETDVWESTNPGEEENFSPERFLEWLEIWSDLGPATLTSRLQNLGSQLFALTLANYVVVVDIYEVGVSGWADTFERFAVMPREEETWPLIHRFLVEIWDEDSAYLEEALAYCCQRRSLTVEKTYITDNEALAPDVAGERDRHRRERGYVTPLSASAFLQGIRSKSLDEILLESNYDTYTEMQLKRMRNNFAGSSSVKSAQTSEPSAANIQPPTPDKAVSQLEELETLLEPILHTRAETQRLLLSGPTQAAEMYLDLQLRELGRRNQTALNLRFNEIVYLANVLVEGTTLQSKRMSEEAATRCVRMTCNLGLMYCVFESPWDNEAEILTELLEAEPGLTKTFQVGYRLIAELPDKVRIALHRALMSAGMQRKLQKESWIQEMVMREFLAEQETHFSFGHRSKLLERLLDALLFLCDSSTCEQLRIVGDSLPRFPNSLEPAEQSTIHIDKTWRFIATPDEIRRLLNWLDNLEHVLL